MRSFVFLCCAGLLLSSCTTGADNQAAQASATEARQDRLCKSWGFRKGTLDYGKCRQSLYQQQAQNNAQRRKMAAAFLMNRLTPAQTYVVTPSRPMNCTSSQAGTIITTGCY